MALRLAALVAACLGAIAVAGHGMLSEPAARNVLANSDWCPQCLSAGGPAVVGGGATWPAGRHGICGDPAAGPLRHEVGGSLYTGRVTAWWTEGSVVNLTVTITAFHKGRLAFRICRIQGTDAASEKAQLSEECLNQNIVRQAAVPGAQAPGDPFYHLGQTGNAFTYRMPYQLPQNLTCNGQTAKCVLQFHYLTGNSCDPPGEPAQYSSPQLGVCGAGGAYPEEFWNCADIRILPVGVPLPSPSASPPPSPPLPVSPPMPDPNPSSPAPSGNATLTDPCRSGNATCYCAWQSRDGMFADAEAGCTAYYHCIGLASYYRLCPAGLLFNDAQLYCDWPANVRCTKALASPPPPAPRPSPVVSSPPPSPRPSPPLPPPPRPSSPPPSPRPRPPPSPRPQPPPSPRPRPPPPPPLAKSPPPPVAKTPPPSPSAAPLPAAQFCAACAPATGFFRDPSDATCRGYYRCEGAAGAWYFTCRIGLAFNEVTRACDWPANVVGCGPLVAAKVAGRRMQEV